MLWEYLKKSFVKNSDSVMSYFDKKYTYGQILKLVQQFASKLEKNKKYGVLCKNEFNTAVGILSCLAAGAVAVPLSYSYGEKHYSKIIETMKVSHLIVDDNNELCVKISESDMEETEDLTDVAIVLSTSGTTGTPKGAMITATNLLSNIKDIQLYFDITPDDNILIARPLYHCAVLTGEFLISVANGVNIHFYNESFNPVKIINYIRKNSITVMCGTPTLFYYICNVAKRQTDLLPLKTIALSGECMTEAVASELIATFPNTRKYNVYGLTEASPRVAYLSPDLFEKYPLSVGKPLSSISAKIVDENNNELPSNHDGELIVCGPNVMKGYYADRKATEKAVQNGWLHTGDIACKDDNGNIFIKSRKDNMIIRSGMNIYPSEIENVIKQDNRIEEALAFGVQSELVGQKIVLNIVAKEQIDNNEIFNLCNQHLPTYQMPDVIDFVDKIAHNASGKVVRPKC